MKAQNLSGVWVPICTPFTRGEVDISKLEHNLKIYSQTKLKGYFALGSNGEACMLNEEEKKRVLRTVLRRKERNIEEPLLLPTLLLMRELILPAS